MAYSCRIVADSISAAGVRVTTILGTFPRIMLAEVNTHRLFSRNSASSRAVPTPRLIGASRSDPFVPVWWGKNQAGMQAAEAMSVEDAKQTEAEWLELAEITRSYVERWHLRGAHKQVANRPLEWFSWHTALITSTEWSNFLRLRAPAEGPLDPTFPAQPEFQAFSVLVRDLLKANKPEPIFASEWHLPFIDAQDLAEHPSEVLRKVSVARCARTSYVRQDERLPLEDDLKVYTRLASSGHWSPFEHQARAIAGTWNGANLWSGNLRGWHQHRADVDPDFTRVVNEPA